MALHVLILAGGSGTRLWPLSRAGIPKHLLPLGPDGVPLLRATVQRVAPLAPGRVHVVTAAAQVQACQAALAGVTSVSVIAEPAARGTGPALGLAVHAIAAVDPGAVIASVHADADIADDEAYRAAVIAAAGWAAAGNHLACVGLTPRFPATGLGWVALGPEADPRAWSTPDVALDPVLTAAAATLPAHRAVGFVEKPGAERAQAFVDGGRHLWNLGLFAFTAAAFLDELRTADPGLDDTLAAVTAEREAGRPGRADDLYAALDSIPVEPLVFERTSRLMAVRAGFAWSDLGSWSDLAEARAGGADADGNVCSGDAVTVASRDCLVEAGAGRLVAVVGADGLVVVDTGDALLVVPRVAAQRVKEVVERLRDLGRTDVL